MITGTSMHATCNGVVERQQVARSRCHSLLATSSSHCVFHPSFQTLLLAEPVLHVPLDSVRREHPHAHAASDSTKKAVGAKSDYPADFETAIEGAGEFSMQVCNIRVAVT